MTSFKRQQQKYVKKPYRVRNWSEYEAGLRSRGSLTVWIEIDAVSCTIPGWDAPVPRPSLAPQIRRWTLIRSVWICDKIRQRVIVPRGGMNRL